jgi:hypothetical protein
MNTKTYSVADANIAGRVWRIEASPRRQGAFVVSRVYSTLTQSRMARANSVRLTHVPLTEQRAIKKLDTDHISSRVLDHEKRYKTQI